MSEYTLNGILTFDKETGPSVSTQSAILDDLKNISKAAFGNDFNANEEGTEWHSFLESLSGALADFGGAAVQIFNNISVNNATGITLDTICSLNGIHRKEMVPAYVVLTCTIPSVSDKTVTIPSNTIFKDSLGQLWTNSVEGYFESGETSINLELKSIEDDPDKAFINAKASWYVMTGDVSPTISFTNDNVSILGSPVETDAQLRYRYMSSYYKQTTGTMDGLRSQILALNNINYCAIEMNTSATEITGSDPYAGLAPHSICVMVDEVGHKKSTTASTNSTDDTDRAIAKTILLYKSLGCGTSSIDRATFSNGKGNISCTFDAKDYDGPEDTEYTITFVRVLPVSWGIHYEILDGGTSKSDYDDIIEKAINNYVESLTPGTSIYNGAIYAVISDVLYTRNKNWQISLKLYQGDSSTDTNVVKVEAYQYAAMPTYR